jgi:hypothetical protein
LEVDVGGGSIYMQVEVVIISHRAMAPPTLIIGVGDDIIHGFRNNNAEVFSRKIHLRGVVQG